MAGAALALAVATVAVAFRPAQTERQDPMSKARPKLLLLTSLPLVFNEEFTLDAPESPALKALSSSFEVLPISVSDGADLGKGRVLLMAQPFAQTAENLVVLDSWVRRGGRLLLLADPLLEWPSKLPLGDVTRPPPMFSDTGLLAHWGLRLEGPERRGMVIRQMGSYRVVTVSPGRLAGHCNIRDQGLDARCRIGRGEVIIVADADFLNTAALGPEGSANLEALMEQLANLVRP